MRVLKGVIPLGGVVALATFSSQSMLLYPKYPYVPKDTKLTLGY